MTEQRTTTSARLVGWSEHHLRRVDARLPRTRFGRFGVAHAVTAGADAATSLALAGSLFFDLEPGAAKSKVLQYLLISLAPFVVVAPFIGPLVDRLGNRRRWVTTGTSVIKAITVLFMAAQLQSLWLFPLAFTLLVSGKAAAVARSSLVPEIVRNEEELVRANSRLSLIAVFGGAVGLAPAWLIRNFAGNPWLLRAACVGFVAAAIVSIRIRLRPRAATHDTDADKSWLERANTYSEAVRVNGFIMSVIRAAFGLIMFLSLFALRNDPLWWSGLTLGALSSGTSIGALVADRLRRRFSESKIIIGAAIGIGVVAAGCAVDGGRVVGAVVAGTIGLASSIARLSFDAIVQRDQPVSGQGAAFARFETKFQLAWVVGALLATGLEPPRYVGLLLIAIGMAAAVAVGVVGEPALEWMIAVRARVVAKVFRRKRQTIT
jgi:MFS family permease